MLQTFTSFDIIISHFCWKTTSISKFVEIEVSEYSKAIANLAIFVYLGFREFVNLLKLSLSAYVINRIISSYKCQCVKQCSPAQLTLRN